jgi:hypothetical protein
MLINIMAEYTERDKRTWLNVFCWKVTMQWSVMGSISIEVQMTSKIGRHFESKQKCHRGDLYILTIHATKKKTSEAFERKTRNITQQE